MLQNSRHAIRFPAARWIGIFSQRLRVTRGYPAVVAIGQIALLLVAMGSTTRVLFAEQPSDDSFVKLAASYTSVAQPLMQQFCLKCHSMEEQEGDLDLERFKDLTAVRHDVPVWLHVVEMLDNGEMPPKDAPQPTPEQRKQLREWIGSYLHAEALAHAGDPGPVVLRRLNNAEYTYSIRDLTGVPLDPAREFPADSAAGEGFTNTGNSLVMSPSLLTKYLDAGKEIAAHAELLPNGFRFTESTTRSDWTNTAITRIRALYQAPVAPSDMTAEAAKGIEFDVSQGIRLPFERYLTTTLAEKKQLKAGESSMKALAEQHGLNAKYLGTFWNAVTERTPSLLLGKLGQQWNAAKSDDARSIVEWILQWQKSLWRFSTIGHIGRENGPKAWQEPVTPLVHQQEVRLPLPAAADQKEMTLRLVARDAGDGNASDFVVWHQPRLVAPGRLDLPLAEVRRFYRDMARLRERLATSTSKALVAASSIDGGDTATKIDSASIARQQNVDVESLNAWLDYLGIGESVSQKIDRLTSQRTNVADHSFVRGWGSAEAPFIVANSSEQEVRIPGTVKPHGICVHPSVTSQMAIGWQSPIAGTVQIEGQITHVNPECGNGVSWLLELRRGATRQKLASGEAHGSTPVAITQAASVTVRPGDFLSLLIGPRDDQGCDFTEVEFVIKSSTNAAQHWNLAQDVSPDILAGNPHADQFGNDQVWHFYKEPVTPSVSDTSIPPGSLLARWQAATTDSDKTTLATAIQNLLATGPVKDASDPDSVLHKQLAEMRGPFLMRAWQRFASDAMDSASTHSKQESTDFGLDPVLFGKHPRGLKVDATSLCVQAPSVVEIRLPADLVAESELVTLGSLHAESGGDGSVQLEVTTSNATSHQLEPSLPVIVQENSAASKRFHDAFDDFRQVFPIALCYSKIVPVDEVVTLTLFHREDEPLRRLMLSDSEIQQLEDLWGELRFVSQEALRLVDAYEQLAEYVTQDRPELVIAFAPMRKPIFDRAETFRKELVDAEPHQIDAIIDFAGIAYRRPLTEADRKKLLDLYQSLRKQELPHEEAFRFVLARIFIAPDFLYRLERAPDGTQAQRISDSELANRLSYFLWSSAPDAELRKLASLNRLHEPAVLTQQAKRMLVDSKTRRFATEFACQWLHIYQFDSLDEKSEKYFPEFGDLRGDMYEESIQFFADLFQRDGSLRELMDADHTFLNERLAKFYGISNVQGDAFRRVDGIREHGRGGILAFATTLAKQSGASRTSPILRGNWICEVLLGDKLPRPPKDVPRLPDDEQATDGLTVRELVARHTSDVRCQSCHQKIDPFGFALEGYDAIGRLRQADLANRPIDVRTTLPGGQPIDGLTGLRNYLANDRREVFLRQFCRKLLGYSLGRATQLSDEPLLDTIQQQLAANDYRFSTAIETIILSEQFLKIRGKAFTP